MRSVVLAALVAIVALSSVTVGQSPPADQATATFEVASIKRNTSNSPGSSSRTLPTGQTMVRNLPFRLVILRAYPLEGVPEIFGLPSWAESERYDVSAKGPAGAPREQQLQMWRALLADRAKLAAHYETRERPGYDLVLARADRRLGPHLKTSTLDCAKANAQLKTALATMPPIGGAGGPQMPPPPGAPPTASALPAGAAGGPPPGVPFVPATPEEAMSRCGFSTANNHLYSGGLTMSMLASLLRSAAGRPIIDRTGLDGEFAVDLFFSTRPPETGQASIDEGPSVFAALPDQLGLKLESSKTQIQVLVVDHIERPTDD